MDLPALVKTSLLYSAAAVQVYRGQFQGYPVVIKEVTFASSAESAAAVIEIQTQYSLSHNNICKVYMYEYCGDRSLCIVLESMECDLKREIDNRRKNRFPWREEELWMYCWTLVDTFAYMQEKGVCHRDIKPQNIFLTHDKQLKIGDFGSARFSASSIATTLAGTPYFLSPELKWRLLSFNHSPESYNPYKSDVYSLGLTFLCMICLEESAQLKNLDTLESETQRVVQALAVSDIMKKLLSLMLGVGDRPDFLGLREYIQALYQPAAEPSPETTQPTIHAAVIAQTSVSMTEVMQLPINLVETVQPTSKVTETEPLVDIQSLFWRFSENPTRDDLRTLFSLGIKFDVYCWFSFFCYRCGSKFWRDMMLRADSPESYFCSADCRAACQCEGIEETKRSAQETSEPNIENNKQANVLNLASSEPAAKSQMQTAADTPAAFPPLHDNPPPSMVPSYPQSQESGQSSVISSKPQDSAIHQRPCTYQVSMKQGSSSSP